ncbi:MAG: peptidoglycan DD-metalloendopeptidase family protein [Bacillota bacterium]
MSLRDKGLKYITVLLLITLMAAALVLPGYATTLQQKEQEMGQTQEELSQIQGSLEARSRELAGYQNEERRLLGELRKLETNIDKLRREIGQLDKDIEATEYAIELKEEELANAEALVAERDELLRMRLRAIYENGETGYLDVLFNAYSFAEFLTRLHDLKLIAEFDLKLLEEAFAERMIIQEQKEELEEKKAELQSMRRQRLDRQDQLRRQSADREKVLEQVMQAIEAQEKAIRELEQEVKRVEEKIKRLQEEMRRLTAQFKPSGRLLWPLGEFGTGYITSPFGNRTHPITKRPGVFHGGIDIGIPYSRWPGSRSYNGNPVHILAADHGVVLVAGTEGGYGRTVIIDHGIMENGANLTTLYAHAHTLLVSPEQVVVRGEPIAIVGSTGFSTGPHLHFEVRLNGERQNPMNFFQ